MAGLALVGVFARSAWCLESLHAGEKLTLDRAIELALENHPRAMQMASEADAARERVGEARSALLPQVYGAGEYLRASDNPIGNAGYLNPGFVPRITGTLHGEPPGTGQSFSSTDNFLAGVGVQQYLFDFGRARGRISEYDAQALSSKEQALLTDLDLIFQVSQAYFALLAANQMVIVFQKAIDQRAEELHAAQAKAAAALTSQIDVLTAKAALARAEIDMVEASNSQNIAKISLDNAIAAGPNAPSYELADVLSYQPVSGNAESYFAVAQRLRPDLKSLDALAIAAGAQIKEAKSDFFPAAQAVAGYNAIGTGLPAANNYNAGIVVTWPIFNGFLTESQLHEAQARRGAVRHAIEDLNARIWLEVNSAFVDLQASVQRIHQAEDTLASSSGQLELADKRYAAGLGNIIELTDAERFYISDNAAYVDALYAYSVAKSRLERSTGAMTSRVASR